MAGAPVSISEVILEGVHSALDEVYVARAGQIVAYDPVTNTATVKPAVKRTLYKADGARVYEELPDIPSVPVMFPRAGGFIFRTPVEPGTPVLLLFCDVSHAEWRESGGIVEPVDARRHSVGYPVAIPGLFPLNDLPSASDAVEVAAGGAVLGADGGSAQMLIGGTLPGIRFGKLAVSPVALATPLMAFVSAASSAMTTGGASDTSVAAALAAIQAALAAIVAIPANAAAAAAVATSATAVTAASTATGAAATAATAAGAAATTAAGAVPSTLVKAV